MRPQRIQRKRTKGFNLQAVSRALNGLECVSVVRPGKWGNPHRVGIDGTAEECVQKYLQDLLPYTHRGPHNTMEDFLISQANLEDIRLELRGKNLACFCPVGAPCHANELLRIAND